MADKEKAPIPRVGMSNNIKDIVNEFMPDGMTKDANIIGSSTPFLYGVMGDYLINPSSISLGTYHKMLDSDGYIGACHDYNLAIISSTVGDFFHDNKDIEKFIRKCIKKVEGGLPKLIRRMMSAEGQGFFVGEKSYKYDDKLGKIYIDRVTPLPQSSLIFTVDPEGRVKEDGIKQYLLNSWYPAMSSMFSYNGFGGPIFDNNLNTMNGIDPYADAGDLPYGMRSYAINPVGMVSIPKSKCIHFVLDGSTGLDGPYGKSSFRKLYQFWLAKCAVMQSLLVAMHKKGTPQIIIYCNAQQQINYGNDEQIDTLTAGFMATENMDSNDVLFLPGLKGSIYEAVVLDAKADQKDFVDVLNYLDNAIQVSMGVPSSTFGSGDGGSSYALGSSQSAVHNKLINSKRSDIMNCLIDQFVKDLIVMNFEPEEYDDDFGKLEVTELSIDEKIKLMDVFTKATAIKTFNPANLEDVNQVRDVIGASEVDESTLKEWQKDFKEQEEVKSTNVSKTKEATDTPYAKQKKSTQGV